MAGRFGASPTRAAAPIGLAILTEGPNLTNDGGGSTCAIPTLWSGVSDDGDGEPASLESVAGGRSSQVVPSRRSDAQPAPSTKVANATKATRSRLEFGNNPRHGHITVAGQPIMSSWSA